MIREKLKTDIANLVIEELSMANKKYPLFSSDHEGKAVIEEEMEECQEAFNTAMGHFVEMWNLIRKNDYAGGQAKLGRDALILVAAEAIQAAAMMEKFRESAEERFAEAK
ncbi:hypothetical protein [Anaerotignum propionicum]|uniref:hypothetical protein n=1 Tax=Anaerotignum propionicum TaxID=28446 RepID=UPI0028999778|nr:hypothetical protein [Anaerotignum propionicum]